MPPDEEKIERELQEKIERELSELPDASEFTLIDIRDLNSHAYNLKLMKLYWSKLRSLAAEVIMFRTAQNKMYQEVQQNSVNILNAVLAGIEISNKAVDLPKKE
jgi:hypothetical protein